jgi:hypothetical protein
MSVPSVGKEEPNIQKECSCLIVLCFVKFGSSLPTEGTLMSYCTVVCEVRFLFTHRMNAHVLLYCVLWSSGTELHKTQYNKTWAFLLYVKRNRTSQNTVQWNMSVPSVGVSLYPQNERSCRIVLCFVKFGSSLLTEGTLMSYCIVFCEVRILFTHRRTELHKTQYNNTWAFLLWVKRNRTSQNTVQ